jgi:8-oxo-dGTP pyrophosphatase MutT (NUDIX family)
MKTKRELTPKQKLIYFLNPVSIPLIKLYWRIFKPSAFGVKVVVTNREDVLIVRHNYLSGIPTFHGGTIEKGEEPESAAIRETYEEIGIKLNSVTLLGSFVSTLYHKKDTVYVFTAESDTKELNPSPFEIKEAKWYPKDNLPKFGSVGQQIWDIYKNNV